MMAKIVEPWIDEPDEESIIIGRTVLKEYLIYWNTGYYGKTYKVIEADSKEKAEKKAYEYWRDEAEYNADYGVVGVATEKLKEKYL